MIIGIVAISTNYAIGKDGKLPWHHSSDLKFFKETTTGNAVVMGSNTWRSIGKPLPNRLNIVLSRSRTLELPADVRKLSDVNEVVALSKDLDSDIYIIGGAKIFEAFADLIDKWIVTVVPDEVDDADTFIPENFLDRFEVEETKDLGDGLNLKILHRK